MGIALTDDHRELASVARDFLTAQQARGMSGAEYHTALKGQSWKLRLMNTIVECMKYAADKDAFVSLMESEGCAVRWERNS